MFISYEWEGKAEWPLKTIQGAGRTSLGFVNSVVKTRFITTSLTDSWLFYNLFVIFVTVLIMKFYNEIIIWVFVS